VTVTGTPPIEPSVRVYLADLVHEHSRYRTFPYAAGCVGGYARARLGRRIAVEVFRNPAELAQAVACAPPDVLGFSHYIWNACLSSEFARRIKRMSPGTVVVMGGPHYPEDGEQQRLFLRARPEIDFYVHREGEIPFTGLLEALLDRDMSPAAFKAEGVRIPACHYVQGDALIAPPPGEKLLDLDEVPSPYLSGLFDKFFEDGSFSPLTQTKRGCPFACTFCVEGLEFYNRLGRASPQRFGDELAYIAERIAPERVLMLADANFGMYRDDLEFCRRIADMQARYGWPRQIEVTTGKNHKERIVEANAIVGGAFRLLAALQSTNPATLDNIKRRNIAAADLVAVGRYAEELGQRSYSELILGLPGDDVAAYLRSIEDSVEAGLERIQLYPLILLPGTELESAASRDHFGLDTRFRVMPHCFGTYAFAGERFAGGEIVEMVVANRDLSFDDYVYCRQFGLTVELFYNDFYLRELRGFLRHLGIPLFEFVRACHEQLAHFPADLASLYERLSAAIRRELWTTREGCEEFLRSSPDLDRYLSGPDTHSLGILKAIGVVDCTRSIHAVAERAATKVLADHGRTEATLLEYLEDLMAFSLMRRADLLHGAAACTQTFRFDFAAIAADGFRGDPAEHRLSAPVQLDFWHDPAQQAEIERLNALDVDPVSRMVETVFPTYVSKVDRHFRHFGAARAATAREGIAPRSDSRRRVQAGR
jgi:radical SAM superfamily enzyme YgiQ (UPF0313 family)